VNAKLLPARWAVSLYPFEEREASSAAPMMVVITGRLHIQGGLAYLTAEKRLSNEFADTLGCAPASMLCAGVASAVAAGAAATESAAGGFSAGLAEACFVSVLGGLGIGASERGGLASATFGLAVVCGAVAAVGSLEALLSPIFCTRLAKKFSGWLPCAGAVCAEAAGWTARVDDEV
jgi:hypothetical protein